MRRLFIFLLFFFALDAYAWKFAGEPPPFDIGAWTETSGPDAWSESVAHCANHTYGGEWKVVLEEGRVEVREYERGPQFDPPLPEDITSGMNQWLWESRSAYLDVEDGHLIGFNMGEWGSSTWWFSSDGSSRYRVDEPRSRGGNPVALFRAEDEVILVSGLAHLGLREGSIRHLRLNDGSWSIAREVPLGAVAQAAVQHPKLGILVVAIEGLLSYRDGKVETLETWDLLGLYPNSIVLAPDETVYVGMRYAVARFAMENGALRTSWWVPPTCKTLTMQEEPFECECGL